VNDFPARTATFKIMREADGWANIIEAELIEGKYFRNVEALNLTRFRGRVEVFP
jgi:hypothetical protein